MEYEAFVHKLVAKLGDSAPRVSMRSFTIREARLKREGFLYWEIFWLAQHKISTPTVKAMRRDRKRFYTEYLEGEINWNEYQQVISKWYRDKGWFFRDGTRSPFRMLEWYQKRQDQPDTPQPKRRKIRKDYAETKAKSTARQVEIPGHATYIKRHRL